MIHEVKLVFDNRDKAVFLPVSEGEAKRLKSILRDYGDARRFIETTTVFGQYVWLNCAHLAMANFLFEPRERIVWAEDDIAPSRLYCEVDDSEPDYDAMRWEILVYVRSHPLPLRFLNADGNAWVEVFTAMTSENQFIVLMDDDGEDLAIARDAIDIVIGTELDRYTQKQIETVRATMPAAYME